MIQAIFSSETQGAVTETAAYVLAPDVIFLLIQDGTARLLDLNGCFYAVPAVGAQMLRAVLQQNTTAAVQQVAAQYDAEARQVQADLQTFLRELERQRLICRPAFLRAKYRLQTTAPFPVLALALRSVHRHKRSLETVVWMLLTLARLSFRLFGWSRTMRAWQQYYRAISPRESASDREEIIKTVDETVRAVATKHVFNMECKERALCCWALLRSAGAPAALVLGVNLFPLASHCWCEAGSSIVSDYQDRCERFTPIVSYE